MFGLCPGRFWLTAVLLALPLAAATEEYLSATDFLSLAFAEQASDSRKIWLTAEHRAAAQRILGHAPPGLRQRYWVHGSRSAWILNEIGKEKPITIGVVVGDTGVELVRILAFRESRGYEVRYPFFTEQFNGAALAEDHRLDRPIDGITGATLSVSAVSRVAAWALYLHAQVLRAVTEADAGPEPPGQHGAAAS